MKKKILIVEDNRVTLDFLARTMEKMGHRVVCAGDGLAALDTLTGFKPDIIFLDLIIPNIGGDKLCRIIRKMQHLSDCYIVILSAVAAEMNIAHVEMGADRCIAKGPFGKMAQHVTSVIADLDTPRGADPGDIVGLDGLTSRQLTRELVSKYEHLETLLESISEGIVEILRERVIYANPGVCKLFDIPEEKILGVFFLDLFEKKTRSRVASMMQSEDDRAVEIGLRKPLEINHRLVTVKKLPVRHRPSSYLVMITDVTRRTQLEMHLQHVQRMDAVGTLAGGVAHNFRNTLAGILVNNQIIQMNLDENSELMKETHRIESAVKKGVRLTESLLQFSYKQKTASFQKFNLADEIAESVSLIRGLFDSRIKIIVSVEESLPVFGDPLSLSQALMNLCTNARDSMPNGGELTITGRSEDGKIVIGVADTGHGMDRSTMEKCFNPFFTTKASGKGTGLGLSTTYGIVKNHGGEIDLSSGVGRGSVFQVRLPRDARRRPATTTAIHEIVTGNDQKVLVVDPDADISEALLQLIRSIGYRADIAGGPEEAMAKYRSWRPDVVVVNINLPEMGAVACIERFAAHDADARVIVTSGFPDQEIKGIRRREKKIVKGYLTQPVGIYELSAMLSQTLEAPEPPDRTGH